MTSDENWPLLTVSKGIFDKVAEAGTSSLEANEEVDVEVEGAWADEDLQLDEGGEVCEILFRIWFLILNFIQEL